MIREKNSIKPQKIVINCPNPSVLLSFEGPDESYISRIVLSSDAKTSTGIHTSLFKTWGQEKEANVFHLWGFKKINLACIAHFSHSGVQRITL